MSYFINRAILSWAAASERNYATRERNPHRNEITNHDVLWHGYHILALNLRELKLCIHLKMSGMIDASLGGFGASRTPSATFSGHEVSRKITLSLAGSLTELLSGLFQELIVAAVRLAAALWLLSCGQMMAARWYSTNADSYSPLCAIYVHKIFGCVFVRVVKFLSLIRAACRARRFGLEFKLLKIYKTIFHRVTKFCMRVIDISSHVKNNMCNKSIIIISVPVNMEYRVCYAYDKITRKVLRNIYYVSITERYDFENIKTGEETCEFSVIRQNEVLSEFWTWLSWLSVKIMDIDRS